MRAVTVVLLLAWIGAAVWLVSGGSARPGFLGSGCAIEGQLLDSSGTPIARHVIWLVPAESGEDKMLRSLDEPERTARTDGRGRFRFASVPPGAWWVGPRPATAADEPGSARDDVPSLARVLTVREADERLTVRLQLECGLWVEGVVLDPAGVPAPECYVSAFGDLGIQSTDTDDLGRFRVGPLPRGTWVVEAGPMMENAASDEVEAQAGETGVVLRLRRGATIEARVVGADGGPPAHCELLVRRLDDVRTNDQVRRSQVGRFRLDALVPGRFRVIATDPDGYIAATDAIDIPGGGSEALVLHLERAATLDLHYEGPGEEGYFELLSSGARFADGWTDRGESRTVLAPPGDYELRLWRADSETPQVRSLSLRLDESHTESWGDGE